MQQYAACYHEHACSIIAKCKGVRLPRRMSTVIPYVVPLHAMQHVIISHAYAKLQTQCCRWPQAWPCQACQYCCKGMVQAS